MSSLISSGSKKRERSDDSDDQGGALKRNRYDGYVTPTGPHSFTHNDAPARLQGQWKFLVMLLHQLHHHHQNHRKTKKKIKWR
jgi:hypothetical protein